VSRGERVTDALAISAPLRDLRETTIAAVTLSGVASRLGVAELPAAVRATRACARAISQELGWSPGSDAPAYGDDELADYCSAAVAETSGTGTGDTRERSAMASRRTRQGAAR
jgi:hypothetical protein